MNAEWHAASIGCAMQNVAIVTRTDEVSAALDGAASAAGSRLLRPVQGARRRPMRTIRRRMRERADGGG